MRPDVVNTPGPGGYLFAWAVSVVAFAVLLLVALEPDPVPPQTVVWILVFLTPMSAPFAVAGTLFVHCTCRDTQQQWRHVLAATAAGAMAGGLVSLVNVGLVVLVPMLAASTGLGRLAVVPVVQRRRRDSAAPAVRG